MSPAGRSSRFGILPREVMSDPELSPRDKLVYTSIGMHCYRGPWTVSQRRLAEETSLSIKSVSRGIRHLKQKGLIHTTGRGKSLTYSLSTPDIGGGAGKDTLDVGPKSPPTEHPGQSRRRDHKREKSDIKSERTHHLEDYRERRRTQWQ
jgi:hypothetical protein